LSRLISLILHSNISWQKKEIANFPNWMHSQTHTRPKIVRRVAKLTNHWSISLKMNTQLKRMGVKEN